MTQSTKSNERVPLADSFFMFFGKVGEYNPGTLQRRTLSQLFSMDLAIF